MYWPWVFVAVPSFLLLGLSARVYYSDITIYVTCLYFRFGGYIAVPGFTTNSVEVNGIEFSYMDRNPKPDNKQPTVVFVHGMSSQKLSWAPVIRSLPKSWRIIAIDLPGHGKSSFDFNKKYDAEGMCALFHGVSVLILYLYLITLRTIVYNIVCNNYINYHINPFNNTKLDINYT